MIYTVTFNPAIDCVMQVEDLALGKINAVGSHDELMESCPIYRETYIAQTEGSGDFDKKGGK